MLRSGETGTTKEWTSSRLGFRGIDGEWMEQIARNLLEGAAVITRVQQLRTYGLDLPASSFHYAPRLLA